MITLLSTAKFGLRVLWRAFVVLVVLALTPIAIGIAAAIAFAFAPVAICGLPFLLVSFLGGANAEHQLVRQRGSYRLPPTARPAAA